MDRVRLALLLSAACLALLAAAAHADPTINATKATSATTSLSATDLNVITAVCNYKMSHQGIAQWLFGAPIDRSSVFLAIQMEVETGKVKWGFILPREFMDDSITSPPVVDMRRRNVKTFLMDDATTRSNIVIIGIRRLEGMVESMAPRPAYANTQGWLYMWLPGYNKDKTEAILYAFVQSGGTDADPILTGDGIIIRLKRTPSGWVVTQWKTAWMT